MRYISFDVIFIVMGILIFTFFILGHVEKNNRIELAKKVYSDPTCVLTENVYTSLSIYQVYKCANTTYKLDYDLSNYKQ